MVEKRRLSRIPIQGCEQIISLRSQTMKLLLLCILLTAGLTTGKKACMILTNIFLYFSAVKKSEAFLFYFLKWVQFRVKLTCVFGENRPVIFSTLFSLSKCTVAVVGSHAPGALLVQRLYVCSWLVPSWYQWTPALQSDSELNWCSETWSYCSVLHETGYRSPLNDFQRSEGRELVPTAWNSARVLLLPGLNLEDCATRCSQSLDCRYPSFNSTLKA